MALYMKKHSVFIILIISILMFSGCQPTEISSSKGNVSTLSNHTSNENPEGKEIPFKIAPESTPEYNSETYLYETEKYIIFSADKKLRLIDKVNSKLIDIDDCLGKIFYSGKYIIYSTEQNNKNEYRIIELNQTNNCIVKRLNVDATQVSNPIIVGETIYWMMKDNGKIKLITTDINGKGFNQLFEMPEESLYFDDPKVVQGRYIVAQNNLQIVQYDVQTKQITKLYDKSENTDNTRIYLYNYNLVIENKTYQNEYLLTEFRFIIINILNQQKREFNIDFNQLQGKDKTGTGVFISSIGYYDGSDDFYFDGDYIESSYDIPANRYKYNFKSKKYEYIKKVYSLILNPIYESMGICNGFQYYTKYYQEAEKISLIKQNILTNEIEEYPYHWKS